jgi:hypothetical protein
VILVATKEQRDGGQRERLARFLRDRLADDTSAALGRDRDSLADLGGMGWLDVDRALREIATKQGLIQLWLDATRSRRAEAPVPDHSLADAVIRELVTVYADHPDYDPTWSQVGGLDPPCAARSDGAPGSGTCPPHQSANVLPFRPARTARHRP